MAINYDKVAMVLVEAVIYGDQLSAKRNNLSLRTIANYRTRLYSDSNLAEIFNQKKALVEDNWAAEIPSAMIAGLDFIRRASREANPQDPEAIHAIAGALKLIAEIGLTKDVIDARLGRFDLPQRTEDN